MKYPIIITCFASLLTFGQTTKAKKAESLIRLEESEANFKKDLSTSITKLRVADNRNLSPIYYQTLESGLNYQSMLKSLVPVYEKYLTTEELDARIKNHKSKLQKPLKDNHTFDTERQKAVIQWQTQAKLAAEKAVSK
ncbi:hypothetical protein [Elizabethkingia ursingii]|uniref:hypothetical protein n=1 Tax=Elizabethkingia ursingii TaxID=1756150 RepID=UPI0007519EDE|nr:hypothetical protein [Elizabethkingia ursingii]KUY30345.1 hypothetical protein ATB96_01465 [Elizabethkingia ursingii]